MAVSGDTKTGAGGVSGSQFFITLADGLDYLDGRYTVFGQVAEGLDVLDQINAAMCDSSHYRPLRDILIRHTIILDDPFPDPPRLVVPDWSPLLPTADQLSNIRMEAGDASPTDCNVAESEEGDRAEREARAQALTLEMIGDLPFAEIKPPENILFVCKLNPITRDDDLETIFARFGKIVSCQIIRDTVTSDSLGYAFIEFDEKESCEEAYFKMDNVLIDDRRIHVDFSQSVSKLHGKWLQNRKQRNELHGSNKSLRMKSKYRSDEMGDSSSVTDARRFDMVFDAKTLARSHNKEPALGEERSTGSESRRKSRWDSRSSNRHHHSRSRSPHHSRDKRPL
ncbi:Peptidyl-prolyl cis-trans isomerase-like 4 [Coemansia sp. RSA 2322]|nr:Peptidyl-prolyl cis-trans isomerase-like 4 [Coemansia sp. RSA 2322]